MFVEEIRDVGSSELGQINFQHPERKSKNPFGPTMDRFSFIALSTALKALHEDPLLWNKTKSDPEAIVFRAADFVDPGASAVFAELFGKPALATQAQRLASICQSPIEKAPSLADFLVGRNIPASTIQITAKPQDSRPKQGYIGVYQVLLATSYEACLTRVGDKVEVIGRVVEVKEDRARNGKPYVFINFGDWHGQIFKIAIWSEGLAAISKKPDASWVGKWVSVVGLLEPPYRSRQYKYSHLSINVTSNGQMTVISETEANWRLASASSKAPTAGTANRDVLVNIRGRTTSGPASQTPSPPSSSNKDVLDKIRGTRAARSAAPSYQRPPTPPAHPRPPEKGLISKFFGWLFK
jgi:hypothetical protein